MDDMMKILREYRLQYTVDEMGDGMELVDILTPPGDESIDRGLQELELLADHISISLNKNNKENRMFGFDVPKNLKTIIEDACKEVTASILRAYEIAKLEEQEKQKFERKE